MMGGRLASIVGASSILAVAVGCSDSTASNADCRDETSSVSLTISDGLTPRFEWSPRCSISAITISEGNEFQWWANGYADDGHVDLAANRLSSPVTYGVVPSGATDSQPPVALVKGHTYTVSLERVLPPGSNSPCVFHYGDACLMLEKSFTR